MSRPPDPRGASRRGSDNTDLGYGAASDAPAKPAPKRLGRRELPHTGCRLYQGPAHPAYFPGTVQVYSRCHRHQPPGSIDLGPVRGWCCECEVAQRGEPFTAEAGEIER